MTVERSFSCRVRTLALLALGAIAVHQLRYTFGRWVSSGDPAATARHAYLLLATTLVVVLVVVAAGFFARDLICARRGNATARASSSFLRSWLGASALLVLVFTVQESVEGSFAGGHVAALLPLQHGGWLTLLLASIVGACVALLTHAARAAIVRIAPQEADSGAGRGANRPWPLSSADIHLKLGLVNGASGRAPPA